MNSINLTFLGVPQAKQGDKSRIAGAKGGKQFVHHYQSAKVKKAENNIRASAEMQLPNNFLPFDEPIGVKALFVFPPLKTFPKYKKAEIDKGIIIYRDTKPDLTDNLMKGLCDALEGVVFVNDSRICKVESEKIYGNKPRIEIEIFKIAK